MPLELSFLPGLVFMLVIVGTFTAFLWYGCGVRDYGKEQREQQKRLQETEEARRSEVRPMVFLPRIKNMRAKAGNRLYQNSDDLCSSETRAEIRKAVANAQFFRRRRKALGDDHYRA